MATTTTDFPGRQYDSNINVLTAGVVTTILTVITCLSYPAVIFTGALAPYYTTGFELALISAIILSAVLVFTSSYPGLVIYAQSEPAVVIAIIVAGMTQTLRADGLDAKILPTLLAVFAVSSLLSGLFLFLLGKFRSGDLVRYVPFPVIGGFLAGAGWLLIKAAIATTATIAVTTANVYQLLQYQELLRWLPALIIGLLIWYRQHKHRHYLNLPVLIFATIALFWLLTAACGFSAAELRAGDWLLKPPAPGSGWSPQTQIMAYTDAAWWLFPKYLAEFATLMLITVIMLLLQATGIELTTRHDIDLNCELRWAGAANIACGIAGALPGYHALSGTTLIHQLNAPLRSVAVLRILLCAGFLIFGLQLLAYIPKLIVAAMLWYTGLGFLYGWLYQSWQRMSQTDYAVLLVVFLVVVLIGFIEGMGVGVLFSLLLFVVKYARLGIVRDTLSGADIHSNVERPADIQELFRQHGDRICIITLHGYLFFGTANTLINTVRTRLHDRRRLPLKFLLLDLSLVSGVDSSTAVSFTKLLQIAEKQSFSVVLAGLSAAIDAVLSREGIRRHPQVTTFSDLDHALEWCENKILTEQNLPATAGMVPIAQSLQRIFADRADAGLFLSYLEAREFTTDEILIHQGSESNDLYFIESGGVMVKLNQTRRTGDFRLRTLHGGTLVGELAFYLSLPRAASVIALEPSRTYRLSRENLTQLAEQHPRLAALFHEYMVREIAGKVVYTTNVLHSLIR